MCYSCMCYPLSHISRPIIFIDCLEQVINSKAGASNTLWFMLFSRGQGIKRQETDGGAKQQGRAAAFTYCSEAPHRHIVGCFHHSGRLGSHLVKHSANCNQLSRVGFCQSHTLHAQRVYCLPVLAYRAGYGSVSHFYLLSRS